MLEDYREERVGAAEVAAAFVAARVETHSLTFSWGAADRDRLLGLVVACSTEPVFERSDAGYVADRLLKSRDEERESLKKLGAQLEEGMRPTLAAVNQIASSMANLERSVAFRNAGIMKTMSQVTSASSLGLGRWIAALPKLQPQPALGEWLKNVGTPPAAILRLATLNLDQIGVSNLSSALAGIRAVDPSVSIPRVLRRSAGKKEIGVGEAIGAVHSVVDLAGSLGEARHAAALSEAASDADAVLEFPNLDGICEAIEHLTRLVEKNEQRRSKDRTADANEALFLWAVAVLLAIYIGLWPYLLRP
jgi:hypothetical protein